MKIFSHNHCFARLGSFLSFGKRVCLNGLHQSLVLIAFFMGGTGSASALSCDPVVVEGGAVPTPVYVAKDFTGAVLPPVQLGTSFSAWKTYQLDRSTCNQLGVWTVSIEPNVGNFGNLVTWEMVAGKPVFTYRLKCFSPTCATTTDESLLVEVTLEVTYKDLDGVKSCDSVVELTTQFEYRIRNTSPCGRFNILATTRLLQNNKLVKTAPEDYDLSKLPTYKVSVMNTGFGSLATNPLIKSHELMQSGLKFTVVPKSPCTFTIDSQTVQLKQFPVGKIDKTNLTEPMNPTNFQIGFTGCQGDSNLKKYTLQWSWGNSFGTNRLKNSATSNPSKGVDLQIKAAVGQKKNFNTCADESDLVIVSGSPYRAACTTSGLASLDFTAYYLANGEEPAPGTFKASPTLMFEAK